MANSNISGNNKNGSVFKNSNGSSLGSISSLFTSIANTALSDGKSNSTVSNLNSSPESFIRQLSNENTARTFDFNSTEAEKARDFQEYMSNTSHQREVDDLIRAGLNPVLSANGGASAYSATSASGSADSSAVSVLGSLYATKLNNENAVKLAELNNKNNLEIAKLGNKNAKEVAKINAQASKYASDNASSASRYASDNSFYASKYSSDTSFSSSKYSTDRTKYGLIDNFINGLIGDGSKKSSSSNAASLLKKGLKKIIKK